MRTTIAIALLVLVAAAACGGKKGDDPAAKPAATGATAQVAADAAPSAPEPQCAAKVKDLEQWMTTMAGEGRLELDFGYKLVAADVPPHPLDDLDDVEVTPKSTGTYDETEKSHDYDAAHRLDFPVKPVELHDRLAKTFALHHAADDANAGPDDSLRVDVDEAAPWSAVVTLASAAASAGYTRLVFVFTAKSALSPPPPSAQSAAIAKDWMEAQETVEKPCKDIEHAFFSHVPKPKRADEALAIAHELPAAVLKCNCAADLAALKELWWAQESRPGPGKLRTSVTIELPRGDMGAPGLALPKATTWSDAAPKIIEAAGKGGKLLLIAK